MSWTCNAIIQWQKNQTDCKKGRQRKQNDSGYDTRLIRCSHSSIIGKIKKDFREFIPNKWNMKFLIQLYISAFFELENSFMAAISSNFVFSFVAFNCDKAVCIGCCVQFSVPFFFDKMMKGIV